MTKITITEARQILEDHLSYDNMKSELAKMTDEDLLKVDICKEFDFDSLDCMDMLTSLYTRYRIWIEDSAMIKSSFTKEPTVGNFIKFVNECIESREFA